MATMVDDLRSRRFPEIVGVRLSAAAYGHGSALALPEKVAVARPTGVGPARTRPGFRMIPIEGANDWGTTTVISA